jgi:hypothetical protein
MKRILSCFLLTLCVCTSLYALRGPVNGRYYNRDYHKRTINSLYGNINGQDTDTTGMPSLYTTAYTEVDVDWYTEPELRQGIYFYATSTCNGSAPQEEAEDCGGDYMVDAWVINKTPDLKTDTWTGYVIKKAERDDFDWWADGSIRGIEGEGNTKEERERDKKEKQKAAIHSLLLSSTDANASVNGGPGESYENSNSGSCGSGSCGPGDDDWGQSVADGTF